MLLGSDQFSVKFCQILVILFCTTIMAEGEDVPPNRLKSIITRPVRISVDSTCSSSKREHLLMSPTSAQSAGSFSIAFDSLQQQDETLRRRVTAEVGR